MNALDFKQKLEQLKYELTEKPKEMLTTQAKNKLLGLEEGEKMPAVLKPKTAGANGIPVDMVFWDGVTDTYPAVLTGGWERSLGFLSDPRNAGYHVAGLHCGVDMTYLYYGNTKIPVYATHNGIITDITNGGTNPLYLQNGVIRTVYAHMFPRDIIVEKGDRVSAGDVLGYMGYAGMTDTNDRHLHYEIQFDIPNLAKIDNTGEYGVFDGNKTWKSINVFTYEGETLSNGQTLGRVIPTNLGLTPYINYFRSAGEIIQLGTELYALLGGIYTVPRSVVLLKWLKDNGYSGY